MLSLAARSRYQAFAIGLEVMPERGFALRDVAKYFGRTRRACTYTWQALDMMTMNAPTARRASSPLALIAQAAQSPAHWPGKTQRLVSLIGRYARGEHRAGLERLAALGVIDAVPSDPQLFAGAIDMLRFWISPASADYYRSIGIDYTFHQVLRFLDEPASLGDPIGLFSTRDSIIGHLMQVVHANPRYDLELLLMHPGGIEELEAQIIAMLRGDHPRAASIAAIVEEPDYHARLLDYVRAFRACPTAPPPLRANIAGKFDVLEQTFGSIRPAMRYFSRLPDTWPAAIRHVLTTRELT